MSIYNLEVGSDGCPNDCSYCRDTGFPCIYKSDKSPLAIKPYTCCICGNRIASTETYSHKDRDYCKKCFERVIG